MSVPVPFSGLRVWRRGGATILLLMLAATAAEAQDRPESMLGPNMKYDGRPYIARLKYDPMEEPRGCNFTDSPAGRGWGHDYPESVHGLMQAVTRLTAIQAADDSIALFEIDDPQIMKYPVLMLTEPGCWNPTDGEAKLLRSYLRRGGFLIVDDGTFGACWKGLCEASNARFEAWVRRVVPGGEVVPVPHTDPILNGFFQINPEKIQAIRMAKRDAATSQPHIVRGVYEDNDTTKRLMIVATYWASIGQNWRGLLRNIAGEEAWIPGGQEGVRAAYWLGMNYLIYGLSH